jgi:hypothetical protein
MSKSTSAASKTLPVTVLSVTSPARIAQIAKEKALNSQEVYVRVTCEYEGKTFTVSNKLRFLGQAGYTKLIQAKTSKETLTITISPSADGSNYYFYLEGDDVTVDDLFKEPVTQPDIRVKVEELYKVL